MGDFRRKLFEWFADAHPVEALDAYPEATLALCNRRRALERLPLWTLAQFRAFVAGWVKENPEYFSPDMALKEEPR